MTNGSYFNISEIRLSITSLFSVKIMSYLGVLDMIYSDVIDSFVSKILKYKSSVIISSTEKPWALLVSVTIVSQNDCDCEIIVTHLITLQNWLG